MSASRRREGRETREDGRAAGARLSRPGRKVQRGALGPVLAVHVVARGDPLAERVHVARASGGEDVQSRGGLVPHRRRRRRRRHAEVTASECARRASPLAIFISCTPAEHRELRVILTSGSTRTTSFRRASLSCSLSSIARRVASLLHFSSRLVSSPITAAARAIRTSPPPAPRGVSPEG